MRTAGVATARRAAAIGGLTVAGLAFIGLLSTSGEQRFVDLPATVQPAESEPSVATTATTSDVDARADPSGSAAPACATGTTASLAAATPYISEVHYHPDSLETPEFIELSNDGDDVIDLTGWSVQPVVECWEDAPRLEPGGRVVLELSDQIDNGGTQLTLEDPRRRVVDVIEFGDSGAWPALADGSGLSLQRIDGGQDGRNPGNWVAETPTPGSRPMYQGGVMPVWSDVEHETATALDTVATIRARLGGVESARAEVAYRIDFGPEQTTTVGIGSDGVAVARFGIPANAELVRYRLIASTPNGASGTWPRQGDGARFTGFVLPTRLDGTTELPRVRWFMEETDYEAAIADTEPGSDATFPAVVAIDGEVFDGTRARLKGRSSRGFPKPKWKFELPPGHRTDLGGAAAVSVTEFALHANYNDKSFVREILSYEAFARAGLPTAEAFPVQLERNGDFYGLYTYVEAMDGTWRDRVGLGDGIVYEVGAETAAFLSEDEADLDQDELRLRYDPDGEIADDEELRNLLRRLGASQSMDTVDRRQWIFDHVDVPSIVNTLAVSAIIQHQDFWTKNYRLAFHEDRWTMIPYDLELTWGRRWTESCQSLCDDVVIEGSFVKSNTALLEPFSTDPVLAEMVRRRIATLTHALLSPADVRRRTDALQESLAEAAARDRDLWGTYGEDQSMSDAIDELLDAFVAPQFERLDGPDAPFGLVDVPPQRDPEDALLIEPSGDRLRLTNTGADSIDVSHMDVGDAETVPGGIVLPPAMGVVLDGAGVVEWIDPSG